MGDFPATNLGLDVHVGPCTGSQLPAMFGGGGVGTSVQTLRQDGIISTLTNMNYIAQIMV